MNRLDNRQSEFSPCRIARPQSSGNVFKSCPTSGGVSVTTQTAWRAAFKACVCVTETRMRNADQNRRLRSAWLLFLQLYKSTLFGWSFSVGSQRQANKAHRFGVFSNHLGVCFLRIPSLGLVQKGNQTETTHLGVSLFNSEFSPISHETSAVHSPYPLVQAKMRLCPTTLLLPRG